MTITHRWPDYVPTNAPHDVRCTWYHHDDQVRCRHDECFEAALTRGEPQRPDSDFVLPPRTPGTLSESAFYLQQQGVPQANPYWQKTPLTLEEASKFSAPEPVFKCMYDDWRITPCGHGDCEEKQKRMLDIGLSPDAPRETNDQGGTQSMVGTRFDLMHPGAMIRLAQLLKVGAEKYGEDNPSKIPTNDHLNHALLHIYAFLAGNTDDDHLTHALCRVLFALGGELDRGN